MLIPPPPQRIEDAEKINPKRGRERGSEKGDPAVQTIGRGGGRARWGVGVGGFPLEAPDWLSVSRWGQLIGPGL